MEMKGGNEMRIAVVGAGSMGMIIGALLTRGGEDIVLVDVNEPHIKAMNEKGARITGHMEVTVPVKAITPSQMEGIYDLVIYLAKTVYDDKALPEILPFIGDDSTVLTLQNGVPEERVAAVVGRERTLGGAIGWGATLQEPGVSELTSELEVMTYDVGEMDGSETERVRKIKEILDKAGKAELTTNLIGVRWTKLMVNVSFSGLGAALNCTYGEILDNDKAIVAATSIIVETIKTARALGVTMEPMQGVDPGVMLDIIKESEENALNVIKMVFGHHRDLVASMLQDLRKGIPCEVDTLNGYLSDKSVEAGVPTPVNDKVTEIIRGIEAGRYSLSFDNLGMIEVRPLQEIV
ncbi:MAG: ketopantoate reductase family protein [Actinomycetota bacterium]|nr:ketopantoate reductase family protein [Actinomycetota bacterium]MDD5666982.1 ketopantoate reductase family protein [Actinomycetota bacterium]